MPEKRMFSKVVTDTDAFMEMPLSTQALYFHLALHADDDGFVGNPKRIQKLIGASDDDAKILIAKRYVLTFDSGIIVIKHWKIHNYIQRDRYNETTYIEEKATLCLDEKKAYVEREKVQCVQDVSNLYPENRLDKIRLDKNSNIIIPIEEKSSKFIPPTLEEVKAYCDERNNKVIPEAFISFYESKGWYVGKNKMKDWKAAIRTWELKEKKQNNNKTIKEEPQWVEKYKQEVISKNKPNIDSNETESLDELEKFFNK